MSTFDELRSNESVLSLIDLCRDISAINTELVKKCEYYDKMFTGVLKFCQSITDCLDNIEQRVRLIETATQSNSNNNSKGEVFPELKL